MKKLITLLFLIVNCQLSIINCAAQGVTNFHSLSAVAVNVHTTIVGVDTTTTYTEDTISFSQFYGKKVMVVNTASFCQFTPEFTQLEQLYTQYHQYNFEILGFPCNDFNSQDPHNDSTIIHFCTTGYGVTFQMMSKIFCVTGDTSPVYKWLQRANLNGVSDAHVGWNFNKFLIDEAGHWVRDC